MANKIHPKMPVSQRAKQFMPFAALDGLEEALAQKERELTQVSKITLSADMLEELNAMLNSLHKNQEISITYYINHTYQIILGKVCEIDFVCQFLKIDTAKIYFADILKITPLK